MLETKTLANRLNCFLMYVNGYLAHVSTAESWELVFWLDCLLHCTCPLANCKCTVGLQPFFSRKFKAVSFYTFTCIHSSVLSFCHFIWIKNKMAGISIVSILSQEHRYHVLQESLIKVFVVLLYQKWDLYIMNSKSAFRLKKMLCLWFTESLLNWSDRQEGRQRSDR